MLPLAALALTLPRRRVTGVPFALGAVGELVYDKLPQARDRSAPPLLAARVGLGALVGGIAARRGGGTATALGALTGGLAALASTLLFHELRAAASARIPAVAAAVAEDVAAVALTIAALH